LTIEMDDGHLVFNECKKTKHGRDYIGTSVNVSETGKTLLGLGHADVGSRSQAEDGPARASQHLFVGFYSRLITVDLLNSFIVVLPHVSSSSPTAQVC
jgi:hypothetical protein